MKRFKSNQLLEILRQDVEQIVATLTELRTYPASLLQKQPDAGRWSVAQVIEHLNFYCRFYLDRIETKIKHSKTGPVDEFTPGWLGNYFTSLMQPQPSGAISKKMKSPKNARPSYQPDAAKMLEELIVHQKTLLDLLERAGAVNLGKNRIPISIAQWITLKLGDTFRFFIAHQQRHVVQINNTLKAIKPMATSVSR